MTSLVWKTLSFVEIPSTKATVQFFLVKVTVGEFVGKDNICASIPF